ncbi:MAG: ABC transporter permease [Erysipelotrichaceae bacterium]
METIIDLTLWQMLAAYMFVALILFMLRIRGISREKELLLSSIRMSLQLVVVGYLLVYLFDNPSPWFTCLFLCIMEGFAIATILKRNKGKLTPQLKRTIVFSMVLGTLGCLLFFLFVVVQIKPWYDPQYFIPIAGMLIGNAMTGISLGVNRLLDGMNSQKHLVEGALMLGATPKMAVKPLVDAAFDAAILPTLNSMVGMGIVFLPGMMTGQILSGISPLTAIEYQIAIMLGILGSVGCTVFLFVQWASQSFFNDQDQLIFPPRT